MVSLWEDELKVALAAPCSSLSFQPNKTTADGFTEPKAQSTTWPGGSLHLSP